MRVLYYHEVAEAMKISEKYCKTAVITKKLLLFGRLTLLNASASRAPTLPVPSGVLPEIEGVNREPGHNWQR